KPAVCRRDEGDRRGPQPVSRTKTKREAGEVQGRGGAIDRHCMPRATVRRYRFLEARYLRPLCQKIRLKDIDDCVDIGLCDVLPPVRDHPQVLPILCSFSASQACNWATLIHSVLLWLV